MPPLRPALSLSRALELPKPTDFAPNRLTRLEKDFEGLLDIVADLTAQLTATNARLANARVTVSFDTPSEEPVIVRGRKPRIGHGKRSDALLTALNGGTWHTREELSATTGVTVKNISSALNYLKGKGLAENGQRGLWRKVPEVATAE